MIFLIHRLMVGGHVRYCPIILLSVKKGQGNCNMVHRSLFYHYSNFCCVDEIRKNTIESWNLRFIHIITTIIKLFYIYIINLKVSKWKCLTARQSACNLTQLSTAEIIFLIDIKLYVHQTVTPFNIRRFRPNGCFIWDFANWACHCNGTSYWEPLNERKHFSLGNGI